MALHWLAWRWWTCRCGSEVHGCYENLAHDLRDRLISLKADARLILTDLENQLAPFSSADQLNRMISSVQHKVMTQNILYDLNTSSQAANMICERDTGQRSALALVGSEMICLMRHPHASSAELILPSYTTAMEAIACKRMLQSCDSSSQHEDGMCSSLCCHCHRHMQWLLWVSDLFSFVVTYWGPCEPTEYHGVDVSKLRFCCFKRFSALLASAGCTASSALSASISKQRGSQR